ncbi:MAG TPA: hypothetical protein DHU88_12020 [Pseudomonas sp.]|nr:hypothetical protein [Pseudomonas sp.]
MILGLGTAPNPDPGLAGVADFRLAPGVTLTTGAALAILLMRTPSFAATLLCESRVTFVARL